jgi:phosphoglycerate kinase
VADGEVALLENVRFNPGEKSNDETLARAYADAVRHLRHGCLRHGAPRPGVDARRGRFAPRPAPGPLLVAELEALEQALAQPKRPMVAIVGGAKVSTKLQVLDALADKVDQLIVGGGIANTFLAAAGHPVGKSLCEHDLLDEARRIAAKTDIPAAHGRGDGTGVRRRCAGHGAAVDDVGEDEMILDVGPGDRRGHGRHCCATPAPSSGTAPWACSSSSLLRRHRGTGAGHRRQQRLLPGRRRRHAGGD